MTDLEELIQYWRLILGLPSTSNSSELSDRIEETIMFLEQWKQAGGE